MRREISLATPADIDAINSIRRESTSSRILAQDLERTIERATFIATLAGVVVGYLSLKLHASRREAEIEEIRVRDEHRRQGIGTELMDHAERFVATRAARLTLGVAKDNPARQWYAARGFRTTESNARGERMAKALE